MKDDNLNEAVGVLTRREIEARILKPFFEAVASELGEEKTRALLKDTVVKEAKNLGNAMSKTQKSNSLEAFAASWEPWIRGGALEVEVLEQSEENWRFNVLRCKYAEMYRDLDMADLGATLSCNRDAALIEGFSDTIQFERSQTLMQGASCCDFSYRKK